MTTLGFTVTFHSPFRIGAAYASDGVGAALDRDDPLPADSLKGVMRAAATELLGKDHPAVSEVFGSPGRPSAWAWSSAIPSQQPKVDQRHRVSIDPAKRAACKEALVLGQQAWMPTATFEVSRLGLFLSDGLTEADHILILRCAAAGVHGLGAWRRRGLGWVGITSNDGAVAVTAEDVARLLGLRSATK